ncbi:GDSL esterase/lipase At1g28600 [Brachypodium distachyon]|uniref:GDSL esterase/lipase At1g28600 n=1 Tax=Brachypodium distachyon TaxID=15368 RepID=UPI0001C72B32|nr:GDSL esterase/lipase At1g28600 [Brachypodium distachyon]|eukprot:XP_003566944.3 GDSL esterase/lipase At1g28600 [Brachypodium distachyon]
MGGSGCSISISMCILLVGVVLLLSAQVGSCSCYRRIFALGDSITDTGNFAFSSVPENPIKHLPFGMTYFHQPTGRISDGRVIIDFIAQALGLPLVPPSLPEQHSAQFPAGANFAAFGATALPKDYLKGKWGIDAVTYASLGVQMDCFKEVVHRIAPGGDVRRVLSESLIVLGEIGGNEYNFLFLKHDRPRETAYQLMPEVVGIISSTAQELIDMGAKTILIPGNFPIGCVPKYLDILGKFANPPDYDQFGCLSWFNDFSQRHNQALSNEINRLSAQHPGVKLIYADYYGAAMEVFKNPGRYGIRDPLVACCGGKDRHHTGQDCSQSAVMWGDPANFASWDGMHMTEKAYNGIADGVLHGPFANPPLLNSC